MKGREKQAARSQTALVTNIASFLLMFHFFPPFFLDFFDEKSAILWRARQRKNEQENIAETAPAPL